MKLKSPETITVFAWGLHTPPGKGKIRKLKLIRKLRFLLKDFAERFISGANLPSTSALDDSVKNALGVK